MKKFNMLDGYRLTNREKSNFKRKWFYATYRHGVIARLWKERIDRERNEVE